MGRPPRLDAGLLRELHVLVVDDDEEARQLLRAVLEYHGAAVTGSPSVGAALALVGRLRPDIIVSDLVMPGEDGYALVRGLLARPALRTVPVIALTAYGFAHSAEAVLAAGFAAYLRKPVDPGELCRAIARACGRLAAG